MRNFHRIYSIDDEALNKSRLLRSGRNVAQVEIRRRSKRSRPIGLSVGLDGEERFDLKFVGKSVIDELCSRSCIYSV